MGSELGASGADFEFDSSKWKWTVYAYENTNKSNHICVCVFRCFDKQDLDKGKLVGVSETKRMWLGISSLALRSVQQNDRGRNCGERYGKVKMWNHRHASMFR